MMKVFINEIKEFFIIQWDILKKTYKYFFDNKTVIKAASLTYYSLLSIVPALALIFAIAKGFGIEKIIQKQLMLHLGGQQQVFEWAINLANNLLRKTQSGLIATIGVVFLFWAVMRLFMLFENILNEIWQISKGRGITRKLADYFSIIFFSPIFLLLSSSITVSLKSLLNSLKILGFLTPLIKILLILLPYLLIWIMFIIILKAIPNTKIRFRPALIAGIVAGTLFQITQYFYFKFQIGISNYNAIYGSFAALPLFMIWVHTGWIILIFGANYCYSLQNYEKNEKINIDFENMKYTEKKILYLYILNNIIKNFNEGNPPYDSDMLCKKTNLPPKTVRLILNDLVDSGLLAPTITNEDDDYKYLPTFDINKLTIVDAINIIERKGKNKISYDISEDVNKIKKKLIDLYEKTKALNINVLIKDL